MLGVSAPGSACRKHFVQPTPSCGSFDWHVRAFCAADFFLQQSRLAHAHSAGPSETLAFMLLCCVFSCARRLQRARPSDEALPSTLPSPVEKSYLGVSFCGKKVAQAGSLDPPDLESGLNWAVLPPGQPAPHAPDVRRVSVAILVLGTYPRLAAFEPRVDVSLLHAVCLRLVQGIAAAPSCCSSLFRICLLSLACRSFSCGCMCMKQHAAPHSVRKSFQVLVPLFSCTLHCASWSVGVQDTPERRPLVLSSSLHKSCAHCARMRQTHFWV